MGSMNRRTGHLVFGGEWAIAECMNDIERGVLEALTELEAAVAADRPGVVRSDVGAALRRIDTLSDQLPGSADPELKHYLQRKSYEKARLRLVEIERAGRASDLTQA
jgi:hypothetical protein